MNGFWTWKDLRSLGAGRISRHSPWSFGLRATAKPRVSQRTGRQNSPAARMVASSASPSAAVRTGGRSGPAIHWPFHSPTAMKAVSNHVGGAQSLARPSPAQTRTDQ